MANRIFSPRLSLGELGLGLQLARCRQLKPKARVFSPLLARPPQPQLLSSYFSTTMSNNSDVTKGPQSAHFAAKTKTMLPPNSFKDKVVFVTGGGTGLGKGMSMKFSELGAKVAIVARSVSTRRHVKFWLTWNSTPDAFQAPSCARDRRARDLRIDWQRCPPAPMRHSRPGRHSTGRRLVCRKVGITWRLRAQCGWKFHFAYWAPLAKRI